MPQGGDMRAVRLRLLRDTRVFLPPALIAAFFIVPAQPAIASTIVYDTISGSIAGGTGFNLTAELGDEVTLVNGTDRTLTLVEIFVRNSGAPVDVILNLYQ